MSFPALKLMTPVLSGQLVDIGLSLWGTLNGSIDAAASLHPLKMLLVVALGSNFRWGISRGEGRRGMALGSRKRMSANEMIEVFFLQEALVVAQGVCYVHA